MDKLDHAGTGDLLPQLGATDIVMRLNEAEADEAEGRFTDGDALVRDIRRRADELQAKTGRRRA